MMHSALLLAAPTATADVRFLDLHAAHAELAGELDCALKRVLASGRYVLGPELDRFEAAFAAKVGADECVGVGSGLDALTLALAARGIGPGDEVIVPGHTFIATWFAVTRVGAVPVPVEPLAGGFNLDPDAVAAAIGARTAAIVPVHLYGEPFDVHRLVGLAAQHGLALIDDAAQAHGARVRGVPIGGLCDATAWSFYPGKNLGALGDGGAVTTNDPELAARLRRMRNYGSEEKYVHPELGTNSRLDEIQAAVLSCKLVRLTEWNGRRRGVAAAYSRELAGLPLMLPADRSPETGTEHVFHLYVVRSPQRDALRSWLSRAGIESGIHYPIPCHRQGAYAETPLAAAELPQCEALAHDVLSLPIGPHLSDAAVTRVAEAVRTFFDAPLGDARG
jgi:dTDP-3-amino-3,4,6-trideoxy-alpha-D-glucose transaminase